MEISQFFEYFGKVVTLIAAIFGSIWAFEKWRKREEHFPRVNFDIDAQIVDQKNGKIILDVVATLENKGLVPLKIKEFVCEIRGINNNDVLELGGEEIRNQLNFKHKLAEGTFFPKTWDSSFVYPSVKTNYSYVTLLPEDTAYILVKGRFLYLKAGESHHAGKLIKIPNQSVQPPANASTN